MLANGDARRKGKWSPGRPHEEFLELCAISTTGELSEDEQKQLREHLAVCSDCRQALSEFEAAADLAVPLLSSELANPDWAGRMSHPAEAEGLIPAAALPTGTHGPDSNLTDKGKSFVFAHANGNHRAHLNWNYLWMPFAAAVVLIVALGIYSYRTGRRRGFEVTQVRSNGFNVQVDALGQRLSDMGREREVLQAQLTERDRIIRELRHQIENESAELQDARNTQEDLEQALKSDKAEKQQAAQEQRNLHLKLDAAQASLEKTQGEIDSLQRERQQDELQAASFTAQIKDLYGQIKGREQAINKQQDMLADDRDIRDLMGARDLYIAEVYDVARDGTTRKPYGRVFYTKGKSLVFYAYDLDQQPGVKEASTFQAWGQSGPDRLHALNLGIFYQDTAAKKRWVLTFDDPRTLEQINAVFVTVEPHGGSHEPSGKRLLFASLRIQPNHP